MSPTRIASLAEQSALRKAGTDLNELGCALVAVGPEIFKDRALFSNAVTKALKRADISLKTTHLKAVLSALSERDETAEVCRNAKGSIEADADLRDYENVPLNEDIQAYFEREVLPNVPDAWIDHAKTRIGYEVPFTRYFYRYAPPRAMSNIDSDLAEITSAVVTLLREAIS